MVAVLVFAIHGLRQGTLRQICSLLGMLGGLWSLYAVSQWVGSHWQGARPAVIFWVLRSLVALLAGTAVAALFHWLGESLAEGVKGTGVGWLDRSGGFCFGAGLGACVVIAALVAMLLVPWPRQAAGIAARARVTAPAVAGTGWLFARCERLVPGGDSLLRVLRDAERRLRHAAQHS